MISQERNEDLSLYYWLRNNFPSFVKIVDGFPDFETEETTLVVPTISLEWSEVTGYPRELGNRTPLKERQWYIDVFAKNKSQRDDFVFKIYNDLDDGVPVYDYNDGFPSTTRIGTLIPITRQIRNLRSSMDNSENEPDEVYYRAVVILTSTYDTYS